MPSVYGLLPLPYRDRLWAAWIVWLNQWVMSAAFVRFCKVTLGQAVRSRVPSRETEDSVSLLITRIEDFPGIPHYTRSSCMVTDHSCPMIPVPHQATTFLASGIWQWLVYSSSPCRVPHANHRSMSSVHCLGRGCLACKNCRSRITKSVGVYSWIEYILPCLYHNTCVFRFFVFRA